MQARHSCKSVAMDVWNRKHSATVLLARAITARYSNKRGANMATDMSVEVPQETIEQKENVVLIADEPGSHNYTREDKTCFTVLLFSDSQILDAENLQKELRRNGKPVENLSDLLLSTFEYGMKARTRAEKAGADTKADKEFAKYETEQHRLMLANKITPQKYASNLQAFKIRKGIGGTAVDMS